VELLKSFSFSFLPGKYGFSDLSGFIDHFPDLLVYEGDKSGGDRVYKLVKKLQ